MSCWGWTSGVGTFVGPARIIDGTIFSSACFRSGTLEEFDRFCNRILELLLTIGCSNNLRE
jgi:hypothetical protein